MMMKSVSLFSVSLLVFGFKGSYLSASSSDVSMESVGSDDCEFLCVFESSSLDEVAPYEHYFEEPTAAPEVNSSDMIRDILRNDTFRAEFFIGIKMHKDCSCVEASAGKVFNPLQFAVYHKSLAWIDALMQSGDYEINAWDEKDQSTLLHLAVIGGDYETVKLLLDYGADCNLVNGDGFTSLDLAKQQENMALYPIMIATTMDTLSAKDLFEASHKPNLFFLNEILMLKSPSIKINETDKYGSAFLHYAIRSEYPLETVLLILNYPGVDVNLPEANSLLTPLMLAARGKSLEIVQALIYKGANVHARHPDGRKAVNMATSLYEIREVLVEAGIMQHLFEKFMILVDLSTFEGMPKDIRRIIGSNLIEKHYETKNNDIFRENHVFQIKSRAEKIGDLKLELDKMSNLSDHHRNIIIDAVNNIDRETDSGQWKHSVYAVKSILTNQLQIYQSHNETLQNACASIAMLYDVGKNGVMGQFKAQN